MARNGGIGMSCDVCGDPMERGGLVRHLVRKGRDDDVIGHPECVDRLVKRLVSQGARYLGNFDMDRR